MRRIFRLVIILCGISGIVTFSCRKAENKLPSQNFNVQGTVLFFGEPEVDGCGWMIKVDDELFSPVSLDPVFKKDNLKVIIDYNILNSTWNCGWRVPGYFQIDIRNIKTQ